MCSPLAGDFCNRLLRDTAKRGLGAICFCDMQELVAGGFLRVCTGCVVDCIFSSHEKANVSFLMVLDKTGVVVTVLLAAVFLDEQITPAIVLGSVLILTGTALMCALHGGVSQLMNSENHWVIWGTVSPALQAISNMLAALDKTPVDTSVTTTIRMLTVVVCICTLARIKEGPLGRQVTLGVKKLSSLIIGGVILGVSYLLMYEAFSLGKVSAVTAIVRANFLITTMLAQMIFKENCRRKERRALYWYSLESLCLSFSGKSVTDEDGILKCKGLGV